MKKVIVLLFATMLVAKSFALTTPEAASNFNLNLNYTEIVSELGLDWELIPELKAAGKNLQKRVAHLSAVAPEVRQEKLSEYVLNNLGTVKTFMTAEQYRAYLILLNKEFNECRLNAILFGYDEFDYVAEK
jgi:hypothetical protein